MSLNDFKDKHYGVKGTQKRDELENGYEDFKLGALLYQLVLKKG